MGVKLAAASGGSIELVPTNTASAFTVTVPAVTGTMLTTATAGVPINGPAFSAYKSSAQSMSASTNTKIQLAAENFDTASAFDSTTNYRFTPQVAGYYQFSFCLTVETTTITHFVFSEIQKNGAAYSRGSSTFASTINYPSSSGSCLVYLNGSTDYVELYGFTNATLNVYVDNRGSFMTGVLVRSA